MTEWLIPKIEAIPDWLIQLVRNYVHGSDGKYAAQLLWQRGIQTRSTLPGYLDPNQYQPSSPFDFGQEMDWAIDRLLQAQQQDEKVLIWGDFDADGITATAVLWEGLGQVLNRSDRLSYYIPDRLTESHGLSKSRLDEFAQQGYQLIVTCDTGSTNGEELAYAQQLKLDVIVTDHHTLPAQRPPVQAIINPRYLPEQHPMSSLSGVAVAYKLVEALYQRLPSAPSQPLESLLDLVAIGLIADLVNLTGESRYLAQRGLAALQTLSPISCQSLADSRRPGITRLLELCKKSGDRPSDVAFGLGPRINAVSRIQGDAHFCVELLTSRSVDRCLRLAEQTELANARRKELQRTVVGQIRQRLQKIDLSTTSVIVLSDPQWSVGILGLVAGQIAQEYDRPTILLQTDIPAVEGDSSGEAASLEPQAQPRMARGSARSVHQIDLYQLVQDQAHLLHRFGGHPLALGLSLPVENLPLFTHALDRQLKQLPVGSLLRTNSPIPVDLVVTVADLGKSLFRELKLLEPFGMGNPVPKLLIRNAWFQQAQHRNIKDWRGNKVRYIKTEFELWDESWDRGFPGIWWEHYLDELPTGRCDAIVELDFNAEKKTYEVRLMAVRPTEETSSINSEQGTLPTWGFKAENRILDWRYGLPEAENSDVSCSGYPTEPSAQPPNQPLSGQLLVMKDCPRSWDELQTWWRQAHQADQVLALAYQVPDTEASEPIQIWQQLVGIAKFLSRTGKMVDRHQISQKLTIADSTLTLGLALLPVLGFQVICQDENVQISLPVHPSSPLEQETQHLPANALTPASAQWEAFLNAIREEKFRQRYFAHLPFPMIQTITTHLNHPL